MTHNIEKSPEFSCFYYFRKQYLHIRNTGFNCAMYVPVAKNWEVETVFFVLFFLRKFIFVFSGSISLFCL
jgi:hypothetical protein